MATIQDYLEAAKGAIVSGACDRAISLCHTVLQHYPKHLEAHCLLAEASRERGDSQPAEDLFLRVLSADPESLIARWALSELHEARQEGKASLVQLRIALETNPDHAELRKELVQRSGDRARITGPGLARVYMRGGLFERAAGEFREALAREPQRLDLLVGHAEALWRAGRKAEAASAARGVLEDSPDCLKALIIAALAETTAGKPLSETTTSLWQNIYALAPDGALVHELAAAGSAVVPDDLRLLLPPEVALPDPNATDLAPDSAASTPLAGTGVAPDAESQDQKQSPQSKVGPDGAPALRDDDVGDNLPNEPELNELARLIEETNELPDLSALLGASGQQEHVAEDEEGPLPVSSGAPVIAAAPAPSEEPPPASGQPAEQVPPTLPMEPMEAPPERPDFRPDQAAASIEGLPGPVVPASAPAATGGSLEDIADEYGEWADLLTEEVTLDPDAEARLAAALSELQSPPSQLSEDKSAASSPPGSSTASDGHGAGERDLSPVQAARKAVESASDKAEARLALAVALEQAKQFDEAVAEYSALLRDAPATAGLVVDRLREILRRQPENADAHRTLADGYMKIGRFQQAMDEYSFALKLKVEK